MGKERNAQGHSEHSGEITLPKIPQSHSSVHFLQVSQPSILSGNHFNSNSAASLMGLLEIQTRLGCSTLGQVEAVLDFRSSHNEALTYPWIQGYASYSHPL